MNLTLVIVSMILIASIIYGYSRGFVRMTLTSLVLIAALLLTKLAYPYVSGVMMNHTKVFEYVQEQINDYLIEETRRQAQEQADVPEQVLPGEMDLLDGLNTNQQGKLISEISLPESIREALAENNNREIYSLMGVESFSQYLSAYLTSMVVNAAVYLLTFLLVFLLLRLAVYALDLMARLPVLHALNKLGGVAVSLLFSLILIWIFFLVATAASGTAFGRTVLSDVRESALLSVLYNRNLLMAMIVDVGRILLQI